MLSKLLTRRLLRFGGNAVDILFAGESLAHLIRVHAAIPRGRDQHFVIREVGAFGEIELHQALLHARGITALARPTDQPVAIERVGLPRDGVKIVGEAFLPGRRALVSAAERSAVSPLLPVPVPMAPRSSVDGERIWWAQSNSPSMSPLRSLTKIVRDRVERVVTVTEDQIRAAMRLVWERMKLVIEPSAGVGVAAVLTDEFRGHADIRKVGVVLCGGNVSLDKLYW